MEHATQSERSKQGPIRKEDEEVRTWLEVRGKGFGRVRIWVWVRVRVNLTMKKAST